jgi:hypothetical protein
MFERYTEKARRVIFFARYEASLYGSPYIETEHLLLGLLREDQSLAKWFPGEPNAATSIRSEIEKQITRGERIATSVEVPLTQEGKEVLNLAADTAERLGHRHVDTVHLLIGILRAEESLAAKILTARGVSAAKVEASPGKETGVSSGASRETKGSARKTLERFLSGLNTLTSEDLICFFHENGVLIDAYGKRWNRNEIEAGFETHFAPYAKKNATYIIEGILAETTELLLANVLWKNALLASEQRAWLHRMSFVLVPYAGNWQILLVQATLVQPQAAAQH